MSELDGLHSSLETMNFTELVLAFIAVTGYAMALNGSFGGRSRSFAALAALAAAAAFAASMSEWIEGVMLMALVIAAMGLFVGLVWLLSALCGLGGPRGSGAQAAAVTESTAIPAALGADSAAAGSQPLALHSPGPPAHLA